MDGQLEVVCTNTEIQAGFNVTIAKKSERTEQKDHSDRHDDCSEWISQAIQEDRQGFHGCSIPKDQSAEKQVVVLDQLQATTSVTHGMENTG
jgi:hypothetical protein